MVYNISRKHLGLDTFRVLYFILQPHSGHSTTEVSWVLDLNQQQSLSEYSTLVTNRAYMGGEP